ncbi:hypothetical protein G7043_26930 [Lentzea sp. NEAU-D13]|uniref:Camelysin metallo-endopeptidase n=1 Tax=Lentzea alba TaxID=2714351 RepID=A0A7C9W399_9PSEU|nr:TasA family protein [Lentzea alba]NGY62560.1 hypothetical protein [Lentzea alba]
MTARHSVDTRTTKRRRAWRPLAMATTGGAVLVMMGVGVWASLSATVSNVDPQQVSTGTLKLTMTPNGAGFSQSISNLAPGDVTNRYVDVANTGTLDGQALTLAVTGTGSTALITDAIRGLAVTVTECVDGTWTSTTGVCSGTASALVSNKPVSAFGTATSLVSGAINAGEARKLQVSVKLPNQDETTVNGVQPANTIQGLSTQLTFAFAETQRAAVTSNS